MLSKHNWLYTPTNITAGMPPFRTTALRFGAPREFANKSRHLMRVRVVKFPLWRLKNHMLGGVNSDYGLLNRTSLIVILLWADLFLNFRSFHSKFAAKTSHSSEHCSRPAAVAQRAREAMLHQRARLMSRPRGSAERGRTENRKYVQFQ